jgi:hypothetical protein
MVGVLPIDRSPPGVADIRAGLAAGFSITF